MGKKDDYQYDYLDNPVRFADQMNGALFGGRQVVKPEELEPADALAVYLGKEAGTRKVTPIITLVVYCGTEQGWDGVRGLHDLMDIDEETKNIDDFFEETLEHLSDLRYQSLWKIYDEMLHDPELKECRRLLKEWKSMSKENR